jgi:hypothetical protein
VEPQGSEASFVITNVWACPLTVSGAGVSRKIDPLTFTGELLIDPVAIRAEQARRVEGLEWERREVLVRLEPPPGGAPPAGHITIECTRYEASAMSPDGVMRYSHTERMPVGPDGEVRFSVQVPNRLTLTPGGLLGYTFDTDWYPAGDRRMSTANIEPAGEPFAVRLPLSPAGAIYGRVLEADGQPASGLLIDVIPSRGITVKDSAGGDLDISSEFMAGPLPLGETYRIVARRGDSYLTSNPVTLTPDDPFEQMTLRFGETVSLKVRLVDPEGTPLPGLPVGLSFQTPGHGYGRSPVPISDVAGEALFTGLIAEQPKGFGYIIEVTPARGYQPRRLVLSNLTNSVIVRIKPGFPVQGRLTDALSGRAMANVEVYALPDWDRWWEDTAAYTSYIDADAATDGEGRFRFTRLADRRYRLGCRSGKEMGTTRVVGGQEDDVELKVKAHERYRNETLGENRAVMR